MVDRIFLSSLLVGLLFGCASSPTMHSPSTFSTLVGNWTTKDPLTCESYRAISFSNDRQTMTATFPNVGSVTKTDARRKFEYDILDVHESSLRMALRNEPRLDADGNPVVWVLKLIDENTFCWGRDDWRPDGCTPPRFKCKN